MKLLVCGGRDYQDQARVYAALDKLDAKRQVLLVIHGGAKGADALADAWAISRGVSRLPFPVTKDEWDTYGRAAGPLRNERMLRLSEPDAAVAFPGGGGTADMTRRLEAAGIGVWRPYK